MQTVLIDEVKANKLARQSNVWWEGWDLMIWSPNPEGYSRVKGGFHKGRWGMLNRVAVADNGKWPVPSKYA